MDTILFIAIITGCLFSVFTKIVLSAIWWLLDAVGFISLVEINKLYVTASEQFKNCWSGAGASHE